MVTASRCPDAMVRREILRRCLRLALMKQHRRSVER